MFVLYFASFRDLTFDDNDEVVGTALYDFEIDVSHTVWISRMYQSECCMYVPGSIAQMQADMDELDNELFF